MLSEHACLISNLKSSELFRLCYLWVCHIWPLLSWGTLPPQQFCWDFFMLHFDKCFFGIYWDHPVIFVLQVVNMVYHTDLKMVSPPCIPGINPTWSWYMIFLNNCWIQFANTLLSTSASMFIRMIPAYSFLFLWHPSLVLVSR